MEEVLDWDDEKRNLVIQKGYERLTFSDGKNLHGNYWLFIILL